MNGWTSTGLSDDASRELETIAADLGINKREACSIAIMHFSKSDGYMEMKEEMARVLVLRDKYPNLFKALT
jgi:hypothetical protein